MISKLINGFFHRLGVAAPGSELGQCGDIEVGDDGTAIQACGTLDSDGFEQAQSK
jgi:hypothetical protein